METNIHKVYVKKKDLNSYSNELLTQLNESLNLNLKKADVFKRYDLKIDQITLEKILFTVLSEKPVDEIFVDDKALELEKTLKSTIRVSLLPGQFDNTRDSLLANISLFTNEEVDARFSTVYDFGNISDEDLLKIKKYLINPVDSHEIPIDEVVDFSNKFEKNYENKVFDNFINLDENGLDDFNKKQNLAVNLDDIKLVQEYFKRENRNPNETEIAVIDTYWSDHCRHTTFNTNLNIKFNPITKLDNEIKKAFDYYLSLREKLNITKPITLMNLGTILQKYLTKTKDIVNVEVSDEINACSVKIKARIVDENGKENLEDYLLMFKNETHNHPTEIEPVGGASTCLGGAIRDPLSGRSFVYQAMRVTGCANPLEKFEDTIEGKLPQKKITNLAALGYSSYGNQIGLATGLVDEIYHPGYVAKRLETGAVIAAAPMENVKRISPKKGDIVILLGGRTGRDGIGGATGSSKSHKISSIKTESAQVQKGNAPEERKIQRLFRKEKVAKMIKKCNDFGAGGVSVAIGELNDGIDIHLDKVKLKYQGLTPREIAISESQERMAVVIDKENTNEFLNYANEENLEATVVAEITDTKKMRMFMNESLVCNLDYDFLNTNGAKREVDVTVESEDVANILKNEEMDPTKLYSYLEDLNITSKKNLIELFDSSVGRSTVLNPLGGKNQTVPIEAMCAKIPTLKKDSKTVSLMSYGFNPYLSEQSNYLGGYYAVIESLSKLVAEGADLKDTYLSFQEYYEKMTDQKSWSKPIKSLLGALESSSYFKVAPIGGKDSMSGTFENLHVPPTLISFAVTYQDIENIISGEFKGKGKIGLIEIEYDENGKLDLLKLKNNFKLIHDEIINKNIISARSINHKGTLPIIYESCAQEFGFEIKLDDLYSPKYGSFVVEYINDRDFIKEIGTFSDEIIVNGIKLDEKALEKSYIHKLDSVFKPVINENKVEIRNKKIEKRVLKSKNPVKKPLVVIPAFFGTNSEYDTQRAFLDEGCDVKVFVFKNKDKKAIENSIDELSEIIKKSQILAIPGGFSFADEPDGSGKYIANILRTEKISNAINYMLNENDGLILGICNGFQALVKSGLLPYGKIKIQQENDPTLTFNNSKRHIARLCDVKLLTNNSPWLSSFDEGEIFKLPISHGEGRFVINEEKLNDLIENEQIVGIYEENPNGSDYSIESIISRDGKIFGKMGHSERVNDDLYKNIDGIKYQNIFKNAANYFKEEE
ncbi:MAG: phosphoribosylformylglycinamidine synthase [Peptoniphilaceae bacterium]|nr:phosphoribosylformylglycinamidine synthase [Peptoniphilaceae bacterium]MDY3738624.1 phosphoribosylformylglycinamidine synthase [Peptoniphilaceae bacterium]